jgi:hypothetical protein
MDGKIEKRVCIKICVKLGKSAIESLEMLREAFGEYSIGLTTVFEWHPIVDWRTILKFVVKEWDIRKFLVIWLWIGSNGGIL